MPASIHRLLQRANAIADVAGEFAAANDPKPLTPEQQAVLQAAEAVMELQVPATDNVAWPWSDVTDLAGERLPKDLVVIGARTGCGKTTFALNLLDYFAERRMPVLFLGLEQDAVQLRTKWASHRLRLDPDLVLTRKWDQLPDGSQERIAEDLAWQVGSDVEPYVRFSAATFVDRQVLAAEVAKATTWDAKVVLVDHIHRIAHGTGDPFQEFSATVRKAKELAKAHKLIVVVMAQFNRGEKDPRKRLQTAPQLSDIRGGGTIEEEADLVLALSRSPRQGLCNEDWKAFARGERTPSEMLDPHTMQVWKLKDRRSGKRIGDRVNLWVEDGRITQTARAWQVPSYARGDAWEPA